jgi:phosphoserine phosphatase RsbU/P
MSPSEEASQPATAALVLVDPSGHRSRVALDPLPYSIGRGAVNNLVLRDSRISRTHARITLEGGAYYVEDCGSRHGVFVNGKRVSKHALAHSDQIEFGSPDSYRLEFALEGAELKLMMEKLAAAESTLPALPGVGGSLAKLRAIVELARAVQGALPIDDVLAAVVDAALAITGAERGFLLMKSDSGLELRVARGREGRRLHDSELQTPRAVLARALDRRRELLYMTFDPQSADETAISRSVADLELRSVFCVPLVRMRLSLGDSTSAVSAANETVGLLYLDSKLRPADLGGGSRELVQALAIEASTVLENARLLEQERARQSMEQELRVARGIQQSLLPPELPRQGWLQAAGASTPAREVGGDYYDLAPAGADCWSAVVADVSGKGLASALLAGLLQGALVTAPQGAEALGRRMERINRFLMERTGGEKYATVFHCMIEKNGRLSYVNAAHCPPLLIRNGRIDSELAATGTPVGLMEGADYDTAEVTLLPGDKLVAYTDGVTEAQNAAGEFFGRSRLAAAALSHAAGSCDAVREAIANALAAFTESAAQSDDITFLVLAYEDGEGLKSGDQLADFLQEHGRKERLPEKADTGGAG